MTAPPGAGAPSGLVRATLVYGAGEASVRFLSLLLLPLFTAYLTPSDYGIIAILGIVLMILVPAFSLGLGTALGLCYFATPDPEERAGTVASAIAALLIASAVLLAAGLPLSGQLSVLAFETSELRGLVALTIGSTAAAILVQPLMQAVQFEGRVRTYVALSAASSLATIGLALLMVVVFRRGARGWVEADLMARAGTLLLFAIAARPDAGLGRVDGGTIRQLLRLGLPLLPGAAFVFVLQQGNKYVLQRAAGLAAAGIYTIGFNLGNAALGMPVAALQRAWTPHFMSFATRPDQAAPAFARVMTVYAFLFGGLALLVTIAARPAVMVLTQPSFHQAHQVVGLVALAQVLFGAFLLLMPGPYFARDLAATTGVQGIAAAVSIVTNVACIAAWGVVGAAVGLVAGAAAQAIVQHAVSLRRGHLRVPYDWKALSRFAILLVAVISMLLPERRLGLGAELLLSLAVTAVALPLWYLILPRPERAWLRERAAALMLRSAKASPAG